MKKERAERERSITEHPKTGRTRETQDGLNRYHIGKVRNIEKLTGNLGLVAWQTIVLQLS